MKSKIAIAVAIGLAYVAFLVYELMSAPTLDKDGKVIGRGIFRGGGRKKKESS